MATIKQLLLTSILGLSIVSANPLLQARAVCNADNCARAVTGVNGKVPLASRSADCVNQLIITATPPTTTFTATFTQTYPTSTVSTATTTVYTTTETVTVSAANNKIKRDSSVAVTPAGSSYASSTTIPTYIGTACGTGTTSLSRYSSACSCFGARTSTTTLPTPSTTITITTQAATPLTTATVTVSTATTTTVTATPTCTNGPTTASNGARFTVICDEFYLASQFTRIGYPSTQSSFQACIDTCEANSQCVGLTFQYGYACSIFSKVGALSPPQSVNNPTLTGAYISAQKD